MDSLVQRKDSKRLAVVFRKGSTLSTNCTSKIPCGTAGLTTRDVTVRVALRTVVVRVKEDLDLWHLGSSRVEGTIDRVGSHPGSGKLYCVIKTLLRTVPTFWLCLCCDRWRRFPNGTLPSVLPNILLQCTYATRLQETQMSFTPDRTLECYSS
jgi:hypothetical protein